LHHFNADQRAELAAAARKTLDDEVVMLRTAIKGFFQAVRREEDADAIERMADSLNLLGLSCSRWGMCSRSIRLCKAQHKAMKKTRSMPNSWNAWRSKTSREGENG
jgi:hypothetical protein